MTPMLTHAHSHIQAPTWTYTSICIHTSTHTHTCTYTGTHKNAHTMHTWTFTCTHIQAHINRHTHRHTNEHREKENWLQLLHFNDTVICPHLSCIFPLALNHKKIADKWPIPDTNASKLEYVLSPKNFRVLSHFIIKLLQLHILLKK